MQILTKVPLNEIVYYKIGGVADTVFVVSSKEDIMEALTYIKEHGIQKVLPIGLGSNLLIHDDTFDGAILWFSKSDSSSIFLQKDNRIQAFSSILLDDVIQFGFNNSLIGLEWAGGLPSSIGGAVRGNVGAFGSEIKKSIVSADVIDMKDSSYMIKTLSNEDLQFSYRSSVIKKNKNLLVVSAIFQLHPGSSDEVLKAKAEYLDHIEYRRKNHVLEYPSCGSVFKNITEKENVEKILAKWPDIQEQVQTKWHGKVAMGYINKRLGFSGFTVGGAQVSEKHANYIINKKKASFNDVLTIIHAIQHRFQREFGFTPEPEVEIVY